MTDCWAAFKEFLRVILKDAMDETIADGVFRRKTTEKCVKILVEIDQVKEEKGSRPGAV